MDKMKGLIILTLLCMLYSCHKTSQPADLIIYQADIWTGNPDRPRAEAMAISADTILEVGNNRDILRFNGPSTKLLDLKGKFVTPGFIDSHVHFLTGGFNLTSVQLRDASTKEEFVRRIAEFAKTVAPGTWILGGDWDHTLWGGELPDKSWIDSVTQQHPVFVTRLDGHMSLANSLALRIAGVQSGVSDIKGGTIVRDASGMPTGIFKDNATWLIEGKIPPPTEEQTDRALQSAMEYVASHGVTTVHHMVGHLDAIERAHANNTLITRIYAAWPITDLPSLKEKVKLTGRGDQWLKLGGVKGFIDGSLGSHTAAFMEPYTDQPADSGLFVHDPADLLQWIKEADEEGFQVIIHAIGDRANRTLLNLYDSVARLNGQRDRRFRIEHAQHLAPSDIERFAASRIIASMQPYHAIDDGRWAENVIGRERALTTYAFKSLFDSEATVAFGSDWFVAPPIPLEGIYAAVTRRTLDDQNQEGWIPEQKITVDQALAAYTRNGAFASFDENEKGSLEPGKLADFVVIDTDLTKVDPVKIREAKILETYVGGKKVFDSRLK